MSANSPSLSSTSSGDSNVPISFDLGEIARTNHVANTSIEDKHNAVVESEEKSDEVEREIVAEEEFEEPAQAPVHLSDIDAHVKMVLSSRRKENRTMKERRDFLFSFVFG